MQRGLLHALVFIVALVLPIQGMTAVAAGQCMALGHHGDDPHSMHHHAESARADDGVAADQQDGGVGKGATDAHCPPCTSCCAAVAIASYPAPLVATAPGSGPVPALAISFSGIPPESLDRPPLAL